jgi:hypothetical protein
MSFLVHHPTSVAGGGAKASPRRENDGAKPHCATVRTVRRYSSFKLWVEEPSLFEATEAGGLPLSN